MPTLNIGNKIISSNIETKIITSDLPLKILGPVATAMFYNYYDVSSYMAPEFFDLKNKGFVLLPRHHSYLDIPLENLFLQKTLNKYPYHFMKASLGMQWLWKMCHAYPMLRLKDVRKHPDKYSMKDIKTISDYVYDFRIPYLLQNDKVVVMHPQGEREKNGVVKLNNSVISSLLKSQTVIEKQIPFVALNIVYSKQGKFRSKVDLTASRPAYFANGDEDGLRDYILGAYR